jgi:hypothetical protein
MYEIKRHCDDIGSVYVSQKYVWQDDQEKAFDRLYDALERHLDDDGAFEEYYFRHHAPNQQHGTRSSAEDFKTFIEEAWSNPWNFEYISGPELTESQWNFLNKVLEVSLHEKGAAVK